MRNIFKLKANKEGDKAKEKRSDIEKLRTMDEKLEMELESRPKGDYCEDDDDLGYC